MDDSKKSKVNNKQHAESVQKNHAAKNAKRPAVDSKQSSQQPDVENVRPGWTSQTGGAVQKSGGSSSNHSLANSQNRPVGAHARPAPRSRRNRPNPQIPVVPVANPVNESRLTKLSRRLQEFLALTNGQPKTKLKAEASIPSHQSGGLMSSRHTPGEEATQVARGRNSSTKKLVDRVLNRVDKALNRNIPMVDRALNGFEKLLGREIKITKAEIVPDNIPTVQAEIVPSRGSASSESTPAPNPTNHFLGGSVSPDSTPPSNPPGGSLGR